MSGLFDDKHLLNIYYIPCTMPNWGKKGSEEYYITHIFKWFLFYQRGRYLVKFKKKKCFSVVSVLYVQGIKDVHNAGLGYSKITANSSIANR